MANSTQITTTRGVCTTTAPVIGARRYIPTFPTSTLIAVIAAFMLGGLIVSIAAEGGSSSSGGGTPPRPLPLLK